MAFREAMRNDELICSISKTGRLIEMGYDPLTKAPENSTVAVQTQGSWTTMRTVQDNNVKLPGGVTLTLDQLRAAPASCVLRLVVGLLGFEVHEKPNSWAEAWLTFQDCSGAQLNIGNSPADRPSPRGSLSDRSPSFYDLEQNRWQLRVLQHLKEHVELHSMKTAANAAAGGTAPSGTSVAKVAPDANGEQGSIFGPDFQEHLELAEFALKRITHAVSVLQSPEKDDRPMILREYSQEMILEVCNDLRQWLDQLATLLSLYHVHLLDLEAERRRLAATLQAREEKFNTGEAERKNAVRRHDCLQEMFNEEKMKRRAEALLGIQLQGEDAKIYTQKDVEEMQAAWEKEQLEPLYDEIRDLRLKKDELLAKLHDQNRDRRNQRGTGQTVETVESSGMPRAQMAMLVAALNATSERVMDDGLSGALAHLVEALKTGGDLSKVVAEISHLPIPQERSASPTAPTVVNVSKEGGGGGMDERGLHPSDSPAVQCLKSMAEEYNTLEAQLRQCPVNAGADKLSFLAAWTRDTLNLVRSSLENKEGLRVLPPPKWNLGILSRKAGNIRTIGVNTGSELMSGSSNQSSDDMRKSIEDEWRRRLAEMQQALEAELQAARAAAERERLNAEEALARLAEDSERADATLADLRRKLMHMQKLLESKGLGKAAGEAFETAGLSGFITDKNVFVRLYRDAMDRMRRMAEAQARFFEEASNQFLRTIGTIVDPNLKFPGLELESAIDMEQRRMMAYQRAAAAAARAASPPRPGTHHRELWQGAGARSTKSMGLVETVSGYQLLPSQDYSSPQRSPPGSPIGAPPRSPTRGESAGAQRSQVRQLRPLTMTERDVEELGLSISATGTAHDNAGSQRSQARQMKSAGLTEREVAKLALSINATSLSEDPLGRAIRAQASAAAMQSNSQNPAAAFGARSGKPFPGQQKPGSAAGDCMLPPLDIRGHGRGGFSSGLHTAGSGAEAGSGSRSRGINASVLTGSPVREILNDALKVNLLDDPGPLLSIGSLSTRTSASASNLLPPEPRSPVKGITRHAASPGRLVRTGGSQSMPHLGPPRLLVQSVGAAY